MNGLPGGIDVGNFVREKFHHVKNAGNCQNKRMSQDLKMFWEMDDAETLEEAECRNRGVKVQTGGKTGAEDETESFERVHGCKKLLRYESELNFKVSRKRPEGRSGEKCAAKTGAWIKLFTHFRPYWML